MQLTINDFIGLSYLLRMIYFTFKIALNNFDSARGSADLVPFL